MIEHTFALRVPKLVESDIVNIHLLQSVKLDPNK